MPIKDDIKYAESGSDRKLEGYISKFDPVVAKLVRSARSIIRERFPTAIEQVYENYNFLAIGFCTTEKTSDCFASLVVHAKGVALSFYYGAKLSDPDLLLEGSGAHNRFIRLENEKTLLKPEVQALLIAAVEQSRTPLPKARKGYLMMKSVSAAKRRPRRAPSA